MAIIGVVLGELENDGERFRALAAEPEVGAVEAHTLQVIALTPLVTLIALRLVLARGPPLAANSAATAEMSVSAVNGNEFMRQTPIPRRFPPSRRPSRAPSRSRERICSEREHGSAHRHRTRSSTCPVRRRHGS